MASKEESDTLRKVISSSKAPTAIGPYSQAIQVDKTLYISGSLGIHPETGCLVSDNIREQTEQSLKNIGAILEAAGCNFSHVVKTTVLLADMNDFNVMNDIYKNFFTKNFPARSAFQVAALPKNARIEIEAIAVIDEMNN